MRFYCARTCFDTIKLDQYLSEKHLSHTLKTEPVSYSTRYLDGFSQQV